MKATHWFVGLALIAVALSSAEAATTFYVDNCGHDTWCNGQSSACWNGVSQSQTCARKTIQQGMSLGLATGDVIVVAPGTYTGTGNRNLVFPQTGGVANAITVKCVSSAEDCIIDVQGSNPCNSSATQQHRGFLFDNDDASNASVVDGFTIKNGCV